MNRLLNILKHYSVTLYNARRWRSRTDLEAWQDASVRRHLGWVLPRSSFYRRLYADRDVADWRSFPVITKSEMMTHFDDLNTADVQLEEAMAKALAAEQSRDFSPTIGDVTVGLSSGTSGNRGLFLTRPAEQQAWAGTLLAKILPDFVYARHRVALFLRADSNLYRSVQNRWLRFQFFDLLEPVSVVTPRLEKFDPSVLVGPPSLLRMLAEACRSGQLRLNPTRIISVAEVLEPQEKEFLEAHFKQKVHQIYQATEGFLGASCSHGVLHLNEDVVVVQKEWLDRAERKFVPIITDFCRTTQPILRYRLNDILCERAAPCPCGSPFLAIESIEGRCDDMLVFPSTRGTGLVAVFPDFVRRAVMTADETILEYKVAQEPGGQLNVSITLRGSESDLVADKVRANLVALFEKLGCCASKIQFVPFADHVPGAKIRRVERRQALPKSSF